MRWSCALAFFFACREITEAQQKERRNHDVRQPPGNVVLQNPSGTVGQDSIPFPMGKIMHSFGNNTMLPELAITYGTGSHFFPCHPVSGFIREQQITAGTGCEVEI
jgi:hypothetical protein